VEERARGVRVRSVVDMGLARAARAWIPRFPGLLEADTCRDWDLGLPLDPARLADPANERYWREYRLETASYSILPPHCAADHASRLRNGNWNENRPSLKSAT